jgi:hypothetical protein
MQISRFSANLSKIAGSLFNVCNIVNPAAMANGFPDKVPAW